jgi:predicted metalloprotease with PDZ domain
MRNGDRRDLTVTPAARQAEDRWLGRDRVRGALDRLADLPYDFDLPRIVVAPRSRLGATLEPLTPQLAEYFGTKGGLLVSSVAQNTAASRAGLKAGDVITAVNGRAIESGADLTRELAEARQRGTVTLGIMRDRKTMEVTAQLESARPRDGRPLRPIRGARPV